MNGIGSGIFILILALGGCTKKKSAEEGANQDPSSKTSTVSQTEGGEIVVKVEKDVTTLRLTLENLPEGDIKLECHLNGQSMQPHKECRHEGQAHLPPQGSYELVVLAKDSKGAIVRYGSTTFQVNEDDIETSRQNLVLSLPNQATPHLTADLSKDLEVGVEFLHKAERCDYTLRCSYDSQRKDFWFDCTSKEGHKLPREILASGRQYLTFRASCGEVIGPELTVAIDGVPADREPLALNFLQDSRGRQVANLAHHNACPNGILTFECADDASGIFERCSSGNVVDQPVEGFQMMAICGKERGPIHTFESDR